MSEDGAVGLILLFTLSVLWISNRYVQCYKTKAQKMAMCNKVMLKFINETNFVNKFDLKVKRIHTNLINGDFEYEYSMYVGASLKLTDIVDSFIKTVENYLDNNGNGIFDFTYYKN